jgi:uncharacterized membrane protein YhaH (DUF805 family)
MQSIAMYSRRLPDVNESAAPFMIFIFSSVFAITMPFSLVVMNQLVMIFIASNG